MSAPGKLPVWEYQSVVPGLAWPAVPDPRGSALLALLFQLERSQWLPEAELQTLQSHQLEILLRHAAETVPRYRGLRGARLGDVPILTRRDVQDGFEALRSERVPPAHGGVGETRTSGATGAPVRVLKTELTSLLWNALTLRDHRWQRRDLRAKLAAIRRTEQPGSAANWGSATEGLVATGPVALRGLDADAEALLDWLIAERPGYLLTYPSLAAEMARVSLRRGVRPEGLLEVRTMGEAVGPEVRELCREAWGVRVSDVYSAEEVGYIALQCPEHEHYHVQSESVLVEVLDDSGRACGPGEVGRLVVTDLHNFAMPLIRYELGDLAEAGEPCSCGRGLPVLRRILGRVRSTLVTADGARYWPSFGVRGVLEIAPVRQAQFVQKSFDLIEARLVVAAPLTADQERRLGERYLSRLPPGFRMRIVYCDGIARSRGGKFEDFYSEVSAERR